MAANELEVKTRDKKSKGYNKELRAKGCVPAVIYGKAVGSEVIEVDARKLQAILRFGTGRSKVLDVKINKNGETQKVNALIKDIQYDPIKRDILHVDFQQISLSEKLHTSVPVVPEGKPAGAAKGGELQQLVWELEVECLPTNIPEALKVDVSGLDIGDAIAAGDVELPEGVEMLGEKDRVLFRLTTPVIEEETEPVVEAEGETGPKAGTEAEGEAETGTKAGEEGEG